MLFIQHSDSEISNYCASQAEPFCGVGGGGGVETANL